VYHPRVQRLGELLLVEHVVTPTALDALLARVAITGDRLGSAAIEAGASADRVAMALARQHRVLAALDHQLFAIPASVTALVPEEVMRRLCAVPLRVAAGTGELVVAVRDPGDAEVSAELTRVTGKRLRIAVAAERRLREAIDLACSRAADPPSSIRPRGSTELPILSGRVPGEHRPASTTHDMARSLSRRLVERALVGVLIAGLISAYAAHRHYAASDAAESRAIDDPREAEEPPGQLDRAFESYGRQMARCRQDFEVCVVECQREAPEPRAGHCKERCLRSACWAKTHAGGPDTPGLR
jgi:hypothetical protein